MIQILNGRNRILILIGLGGLTALLVGSYIHRVEMAASKQFKMAPILKARKYIQAGAQVNDGLIEETAMPESFIEPMALSARDELKDDQGKWKFKTRLDILKGEQIIKSKLVDVESGLGLAWLLTPDQVAFSLRLTPEQAVGGNLDPGDWVSVYLRADRREGGNDPAVRQILPRVQVLGVNDRLIGEAAALKRGRENIKNFAAESILVTLALSSDQVARLMSGEGQGPLALALFPVLAAEGHPFIKSSPGELH